MKSSNPKNNNPSGHPETLTPFKKKWRSGKTRTIRVPIAIAEEVLAAAKIIDENHNNSDNPEAIAIFPNSLKLEAVIDKISEKKIKENLDLS